jgi:hypothetical protein
MVLTRWLIMIDSRRVWFIHAKCVFYTQSVFLTCVGMNLTHTSMIRTRKKWFWQAGVWFIHVECDLFTQSVILKRIMRFSDSKCDLNKYEYDFDTHVYGLYTQSMILTHLSAIYSLECDFQTDNEISEAECNLTCTNMIYTHKVLFWYAQVWFIHAEWDFETFNEIFRCRVSFLNARVWFIHEKYDFDTLECDLFTQSVISKRIMRFSHAKFDFYTNTKIYTRRVWCWHAQV